MTFGLILWLMVRLWESGEYTVGFLVWLLKALVTAHLGIAL